MQEAIQYLKETAWFFGAAAAAIIAALVFNYVLLKVIGSISRRSGIIPAGSIEKHCREAARWTLITAAVRMVFLVNIPEGRLGTFLDRILVVLLIGFTAWLVIKLMYVLEDVIVSRFSTGQGFDFISRKIYTQIRVLKQIVITIVFVLAIGTILLTIPGVQQLGGTILTSAGIVGIVIGIAAQKTLGALIAGLQIAFTQPIRIGDSVTVENEFGQVEEITLTYVVVKIWDLRRLVVPITHFLEKPFQNWTRTSTDMLGTVSIFTDYMINVDMVREEFNRVIRESGDWDGKTGVLQVVNANDKTIELRGLVGASDASKMANLRCEVREKLVKYIQQNYPEAWPKVRTETVQK